MIDNNDISREEIFVSTKNGYVTNEGDIKEDLMQYVMREYQILILNLLVQVALINLSLFLRF